MAYQTSPSANAPSQLPSTQLELASTNQTVTETGSSAQQREMDRYLNVFKVQPLFSAVSHNAGATSGSPWPLIADTLQLEAVTAVNGRVRYEPAPQEEETLQLPNALTTLEGAGIQASVQLSAPSFAPHTPAALIQQSMQSAMTQNMTYPINPTAGILGHNLSTYQAHNYTNAHTQADPLLFLNVTDMEAQFRRLREENQRMWEIICMLMGRGLIHPSPSL